MQLLLILWVFVLVSAAPVAHSADEETWSIGPFMGMHHPKMSSLSNGLYRSPLIGSAPAEEGLNGSTTPVEYRLDAPLSSVNNAAKAGVELRWNSGGRNSFVIGGAALEKTSITRLNTAIPIQNVVRPTNLERRGKISYTEYYLGWNYDFVIRSNLRLYSRTMLHQLFDVDYREDLSFFFPFFDTGVPAADPGGPSKSDSFTRVAIVEAQTTGLRYGEFGIGAEYFFEKWISLALDIGWVFGSANTPIGNVKSRSSFQDQDNIKPPSEQEKLTGFPFGIMEDGSLGYLHYDTQSTGARSAENYSNVHLDFNGWQSVLRFSVHY